MKSSTTHTSMEGWPPAPRRFTEASTTSTMTRGTSLASTMTEASISTCTILSEESRESLTATGTSRYSIPTTHGATRR